MLYLIHKVSKIFDIQNIFKIRLWLVKIDFIVNQTNCHSPAPPHSFIRLFLLTSSFLSLSCHLFLFQIVFYLLTLTFSLILFFFLFLFHRLFLTHSFFFSLLSPTFFFLSYSLQLSFSS